MVMLIGILRTKSSFIVEEKNFDEKYKNRISCNELNQSGYSNCYSDYGNKLRKWFLTQANDNY